MGVYPGGRQIHAEISLQQENSLFLDMDSELLLSELAGMLGGRLTMGKHAIGGMRSMMVPNRKADMRFRKKSYLRNKNTAERGNRNDQRRSHSDS